MTPKNLLLIGVAAIVLYWLSKRNAANTTTGSNPGDGSGGDSTLGGLTGFNSGGEE